MSRDERTVTRRAFARHMALLGATGAALACAAPTQARGDAAASAASDGEQTTELLVINTLAPRRDSVGPQPKHFEWVAVAGCDSYAIGVWNDVDMLMWRADELKAATVEPPSTWKLDAGTYFWAVTGLKNGRQIANSGRSAFVVEV